MIFGAIFLSSLLSTPKIGTIPNSFGSLGVAVCGDNLVAAASDDWTLLAESWFDALCELFVVVLQETKKN